MVAAGRPFDPVAACTYCLTPPPPAIDVDRSSVVQLHALFRRIAGLPLDVGPVGKLAVALADVGTRSSGFGDEYVGRSPRSADLGDVRAVQDGGGLEARPSRCRLGCIADNHGLSQEVGQ